MQVCERGTGGTQQLQHGWNRLATQAARARSTRFCRQPAPQVTRSATRLSIDGPVVIRRGNRRMVAMREISRLFREPSCVRWIGRGHQRQRSPERVDDLLVVAVLLTDAFTPPTPIRR